MHNKKANLKNVRPFNKVSGLTVGDEQWSTWSSHPHQRLCIEIGCGAGLHPIQWAKENPNDVLIALERTKTKFSSFKQRIEHHSFQNIYPVNEDALYWLPENIKENSVDEYFFLYPNPYPKEGQANKRWHRSPLMHFILATLKTGGRITSVSNEAFYNEEAKDYFLNYWQLKLIEERALNLDNQKPRTHFEKKYLQRKHPCTNLIFQKG